MTEIHRADPRLRRWFPWVLLVLAIAALAAIFLRGELNANASAPAELLGWFAAIMVVACISLVAIGAYLVHLGRSVLRAGRFPLPDSRVLRDTVVSRGGAAKVRGRALAACGVGLLLAAVVLALLSWRLHGLLLAA